MQFSFALLRLAIRRRDNNATAMDEYMATQTELWKNTGLVECPQSRHPEDNGRARGRSALGRG